MNTFSVFKAIIAISLTLLLFGCSKNFDLNPRVDAKQLAGEYVYLSETLELDYDSNAVDNSSPLVHNGTYIKKNNGNVETGRWESLDSYVTLVNSANVYKYIKVTEVDGAYRLLFIRDLDQDPDEWSRSEFWIKKL